VTNFNFGVQHVLCTTTDVSNFKITGRAKRICWVWMLQSAYNNICFLTQKIAGNQKVQTPIKVGSLQRKQI